MKCEVIERTQINGETLTVVRKDNMLAVRYGDTGYSCIYTDNSVFQPVYIPVQKALDALGNVIRLNRICILGGGCCTLPRFVIRRFGSKTTIDSIEYLPQLIELARKHFLCGIEKNNLNLICEDAFKFIHDTTHSYEAIFVDLFVGSTLAEKIWDIDFIQDIGKHTSQTSAVFFNAYGWELSKCELYCKRLLKCFDNTHITTDEEGTNYIIATKNISTSTL